MSEFIALYRGRTVGDAEIVALTAQPEIVRLFFDALISSDLSSVPDEHEETGRPVGPVPLHPVQGGDE